MKSPFVDEKPTPINALQLFSGEWACRLPPEIPDFPGAGSVRAFEDDRITWANEKLSGLKRGFNGSKVLELGPLEAAHTYMISRLGAQEIIAVENNARAYLKCLVVKEVLDIQRAHFLLGDALAYIRSNAQRFDIGIASAFLNHLLNPVEIIDCFAHFCDSIFLWNVVYHPSLFEKQPELRPSFGPPLAANWNGYKHTLYPHHYGNVTDYAKFWGGSQGSACWMEAEEIVHAARYFGFTQIEYKIDDHQFGKVLSLVAAKAENSRIGVSSKESV
jgi:hypothetical protein